MKLKPIELIHVELEWQGEYLPVGRIAIDRWQTYFEYTPSFLERGLELSPFKVPLRTGVFEGDQKVFEGLQGVFNDSLPDGSGKLLLDRCLAQVVRTLGAANTSTKLNQTTTSLKLIDFIPPINRLSCMDASRQPARGEQVDTGLIGDI